MAKDTKPPVNTPGVLILQWLTYAFWGWLIMSLIWLITVILSNAITGADVSGIVPYAIAAAIVLLPIAFVTDFLYRKHEPVTKTGAATVIMVIHAVIFALLGIGALIVSVFTALNASINFERNNDVAMVAIFSALFAALVYAAAFLRTLNPFKARAGAKLLATRTYSFAMLGVTVLLLIFAIVGPVITTVATRNDRLIEQNIYSIESGVDDYANKHGELPATLDQVHISYKDGRAIVADGKVKYVPEGTSNTRKLTGHTYLRYQLCVNYERENDDTGYGYSSYYPSPNEYSTTIQPVPHEAGEVCYKLETFVPTNTEQ